MAIRQRILILSCSGGAGHVRAGTALEQWARLRFPELRMEHTDVLDFTTRTFKRVYARGYFHAVQHARHLWGAFYDRSDRTARPKSWFMSIFDHFNYSRYVSAIQTIQPAAIICTHFLPFLAIEKKINAYRIRSPFFAVGTDFNLHSLWVSKVVRRYFVFSDESASLLEAKGVSRDRISVTGIPVMPEFAAVVGKHTSRRMLGLPETRRLVLVLCGGEGMGKVRSIVDAVLEEVGDAGSPWSVVVIAGRNEKLRTCLRGASTPPGISLRVEGFVENIHDYMHAADIVITKSGGLSVSEALACRLPMIITDPIPGQERHNADVLIERGAAMISTDEAQLRFKLRIALHDRTWRRNAAAAAKSLARPKAAMDILSQVADELR